MTDEQIDRLKRGGHDVVKIFAAYAAARAHEGQPVVILAHTKKGFGMGSAGQGKMTTHSQKKFDEQDLIEYRNRFDLPLTDEQAKGLAFYKPASDSAEMAYLMKHRQNLGGSMPKRETHCATLPVPALESYAQFAIAADGKEMSTTMAFVRMLGNLLKDPVLGRRLVPIVADEARTFGMANLFKQVGIYSSVGQHYAPEDIGSVLSYREALDGQILEEGISEAGALASWTAAATSYSVHGFAMLPFYIYYSMFGFQRVGDAIWAAADQRARGFLLGATSGRTTLGGEGLQHQDGSSHLVAATIPNCKAYDPAFAGELAIILDAGMREMVEQQVDVFYYVTLMNENYANADISLENADGILRGAYRFANFPSEKGDSKQHLTLMGSGAILLEVISTAKLLAGQGVNVVVISVTSWSELARDGRACADQDKNTVAHLTALLSHSQGPVLAASDYVCAVTESVRAFIPEGRRYKTLGTDGFGRSDTRAALRNYFEVDAAAILRAATSMLT
jgi:pyruvate dehydrogenase E1 component